MAEIAIQGSPVRTGERVVYPNGGICRVKGVEAKQIAGMSLLMLMLEREEDGATVMVPQNKVDAIGLRKVATSDAIAALFEFLTSSSADPELDWKVRHRENFGKMAAGELLETAEVLKGLHALALLRPLPQREREMYDSARHQLVGEIAAALNLPPAVAENNIDYALTPPPGSGRVAPKDAPIDLKSLRVRAPAQRRVSTASEDDEFELGEDEEVAGSLGLGDEGEEREEQEEKGEESEEEAVSEESPAPKAAKKAPAAKKAAAKKAPAAGKPATKTTKKTPVSEESGKKAAVSKSVVKKTAAKKTVAKKTAAKKTVTKKGGAS